MTYDDLIVKKSNVKIKTPVDFYEAIKHYNRFGQEVFLCATLNTQHEVISIHICSIGLRNSAIVHPREVFYNAIKDNAIAVIVAHNHPSSALAPSQEDKDITERLMETGKIIGIPVLDHVIFSQRGCYSIKARNSWLDGQPFNFSGVNVKIKKSRKSSKAGAAVA